MSKSGSINCDSRRELYVYFALLLVLFLAYVTAGLILPALGGSRDRIREALFGFSQFGCFSVPCALIAISVPIAVFIVSRVIAPVSKERLYAHIASTFDSSWFRILFSLSLVIVFFALRSHFINYDGRMFAEKFARDVPLHGAHVTHDEMWELYLHSRFWFYTNRIFGWNVELSYQVLSSVAGGAFILLLLYYCSVMFPERPVLAFAVCVSGGYMQIFFGDVENYTLTATWIMAYFLASAFYIKGRISVIIPSVILATALTFHLLAGFLIPSMLVLYRIAWKRDERRPVLAAVGMFCGIVGLTLLFFHLNGLPIRDLWYHSHAFGHGGHIRPRLVDPSPGYYFAIFNLLFLLAPAWILLIPQLIFGRVRLDDLNIHLIVAAVFTGIFLVAWKATLGVYSDWNLFAVVALPVTFLVLRNLLSTECLSGRRWLIYIFVWLFMLHSYSWIISNHFYHAVVQ
jgi:hypothetical protein